MALQAAPAGASVERSLFKSKGQYSEASAKMDAVTGVASGAIAPSAINKEELPAELQSLSDPELEKTLLAKNAEREKIQKELAALGAKREKFLAEQTNGNKDTLDKAILEAVRAQAESKGFTFPAN
jgi:hypothetical protein